MSDVNANIGVQIDTSLALAELKNLQRQLANFHSAVSKSSAAAALAQKNLQNNLVNAINETGKFRAQMGVIRTSTESFTDSLEKNKFSMREYFRYAGGATRTFGRLFRSEFDTINKVATERVKDLQTQYIKMGRDANGAMRAIAIRPLALDMENYATKTQIAAQRQQLFNQLVKQGSTSLLNFGKNTQWAGRQLMVGFSIPLAYLGTTAAKTFMTIEEQVVRFKRVYGELFTSTEETTKVLDNVRNLAKEFTKYGVAVENTIKVAADAAAAGKMGVDLIAQVQEATRLAVLGQVEQAQALETTISLQNAFGSSAQQLTQDINFLNAVENQTVTSIEDLTIAIPKAGPVVKQLGGDVKDLAYFLTAMKEGGINASEGANALKSGLASLINPTEKASAMLADMGINITDIVERNKGNLRATVEEFAAALDTLAPLERSRAIEQLFGKFQFARLSTLFQNVAKEGNQAARVLKLAGASVEELAILSERELKTVEDAIGVDFKEAVQQLRLALEPIGKMFLKTITPIAKVIASLLDKFNGLDEGTQKFIVVVSTLVGVVGPTLLMTFGLLANSAANIIKFFSAMRGGFLKLSGNSKILGEQTQYLSTQQIENASVAAALNQSHNRLVQTFTVEAGAVKALRGAYISATTAAARFAAANPGMMTPGAGKVPKKFATGIVQVPGTGNQDTVPSLLTPGEGVVPADVMKNPEAQVLLQALIEGKLFKYSGGAVLAGEQYSHVGAGKNISIDEMLADPRLTQNQKAKLQVYKDILVANGMQPNVRAFHDLAYSFPGSLNRQMARGGVPIEQFTQAWTRHGASKWISSGLGAAEAKIIDDAMLKSIQSSGASKITDDIVRNAFEKLPPEAKASPAYTKLLNKYNSIGSFAIGKGLGTTPQTTSQVLEQAKRAGLIDDYKVIGRIDSDGKLQNSSVKIYKGGQEINLGRGADAERTKLRKTKETVAVETGEKKVSAKGKETRLGAGNTKAKPAGVRTTSGSLRDNRTTQLSLGDMIMSRRNAALMRRYKLRGLVEGDLTPAQRLAGSEGISLNKAKKIIAEQEKYAKAIQESTKEQLNLKDKVKQFSGKASAGAGALTGLTIAASFAGGKVGEMAQQIMPFAFAIQGISAILPMLTNPWGLMVAGVVGLTAVIIKMRQDLNKAREAGKELADAMTMSAKDVQDLGMITGRVGASEIADRRRQNILTTGITEPQRQFGQNIISSDFGKKMLGNIETMSKNGMQPADVAKNISNQLGQAILQGVLTLDEAASIASALGEKLGSYEIPLNITGNLNKIFGPNGENLKNSPLQVALEIKKDSMKNQANAFQTALNARQGQTKDRTQANVLGAAAGATIGAGVLTANPLLIAAGIGAGIKAQADFNKLKAQSLKLDTATIQLGVEAVAQGQDLIDSINQQYDIKIKEAKTQKEINDLEIERKNAIKTINDENNKTLQSLIDQKDQLEPGAFDAAIKASVDSLYKEGPMSVFKDQALEALKAISDSDFKAQLQLGFASGDIDPLTLVNILKMTSGNENIQKNIQLLISTEGFANTGILSTLLTTASQGDQATYDILLNYVNKNEKTFDEDMAAIKRITDFKGAYDITLDMKTNGVEKIKTASMAIQQIKDLPEKITKEALMKANKDGQFDDIIANWTTLSQGKDQINKNLIVNYKVGVIDKNLIDAAIAAKMTVPEYLAKGFAAPTTPPPPAPPPAGPKKDRDTSLDDLLKRLRAVRQGSIDVEGGIGTLLAKFKKTGGEGWKAFKGIENAMLNVNSVGRNREFMNYLSGLDKKSFAAYVNTKQLAKGIFELTAKGKALNMAFNDVKIGEYVKAQQDAAKTTNAQRIAFDKLIKSGMSAELAMQVVADGEMAVAINTKAANGELKTFTKQMIETDNIMKRNAFVEFLRGTEVDVQKKLNLAGIIPQLKQMGMTFDQIQEVLDNPTIADGLIAGMQQGKVQAQDVLNLLNAMERTRVAKLIIQVEQQGAIGAASDDAQSLLSGFNEIYNAAQNFVDLKYADDIEAVNDAYQKGVDLANADFATAEAAANKSIAAAEAEIAAQESLLKVTQQAIADKQKLIDAAQKEIDAIDEVIDGYQKQIDILQRKIELEYDRPIEALQDSVDAINREIELDFDRPIEALQEESSDLSNDLALIDQAAEQINKKYDAQVKALEQVQKVNEQIINQQKSQISLADALSQGDISAAAQIMQDMRAANAQATAGSISDALQASREAEIAGLRSASGMTRDQIEKRQFEISQQIYALEEKREAKQLQIRNIQDQIYKLEQAREPLLRQIRDYEDQIYQQNLLKEPIIAKIKGYEKEMEVLRETERQQEEAIAKLRETKLKQAEEALKAAEKAHQDRLKKLEEEKQAELKKIEDKKKKEMEALDAAKKKIEELAAAYLLSNLEANKLPGLMDQAKKYGIELANALKSIWTGVDLTIPDEFKNPVMPGSDTGTGAGNIDPNTGLDQYGLNPNDPDYMEKFRARQNLGTGSTGATGATATPGTKMGLAQGMVELAKQQKALLGFIRDIDIEITKQKVKQFENTEKTYKLLELIEEDEKDLLELYTLQEEPLFKLSELQKLITEEIKTQRKYIGDMLDNKNKDYGLFWIYNWWDQIFDLLVKIVTEPLKEFKKLMTEILDLIKEVYKELEAASKIIVDMAANMEKIAAAAEAARVSIANIERYVLTIHEIRTVYTTEGSPPATPAPGTPAPGTPAPGTPAPGTPAPGTPTPTSDPFAGILVNKGGYIKMAGGGTVPGPSVNRDVIPAMLTPGEYVINRSATSKFLPILQAINQSTLSSFNMGGRVGGMLGFNSGGRVPSMRSAGSGGRSAIMPSFRSSAQSAKKPTFSNPAFTNGRANVSIPSQAGKSEVNNQTIAPVYNISVNVPNTTVDPNAIANVVLTKIQSIGSQNVRGQATYL